MSNTGGEGSGAGGVGRGMRTRVRNPTVSSEEVRRGLDLVSLSAGPRDAMIKPQVDSSSSSGEVSLIAQRPSFRGVSRPSISKISSVLPPKELRTKPVALQSKQGIRGQSRLLTANYFVLQKAPTWSLHQYHVRFQPEEDRLSLKRFLVRSLKEQIGAYVFDGATAFLRKKLDTNIFVGKVNSMDNNEYTVTLTYVEEVAPGNPLYMQFYSILLRYCLFNMGLQEMGRNYFDPEAAIDLNTHRLTLWPGYITSLRQHEKDVLLCVDVTHKVLRTENCLQIIREVMQTARGDRREAVLSAFKDTIVMTSYNKNTYRVDDIDFKLNPAGEFVNRKGDRIKYSDYYANRYSLTIQDKSQPLFVCRPTKKDIHRGDTGNIVLIPELCQLTGLSDKMRENMHLMRELGKHLHMAPTERVHTIHNFMARLQGSITVSDELKEWGIQFGQKLIEIPSRQLASEKIYFQSPQQETPDEKEDWTKAFRSCKMYKVIDLVTWAVIVPQREAQGVQNLYRTMQKVAGPLGMKVANPATTHSVEDIRSSTYLRAIQTVYERIRNLQLLFVILPNNKQDLYAAVKKRLGCDFGIPSQCFVAKNMNNPRGLMSICTKVIVQINAKLGGQPWTIRNPLEDLMVVGFDICKGGKTGTVGAMVATTSSNLAEYYSTTSVFKNPEEISTCVQADFTKCAIAYANRNGTLPSRIIVYRDGVSESQLRQVYDTELKMLHEAMKALYEKKGKQIPKLGFIVVNKRINTRVLLRKGSNYENPGPGTIVDDIVTFPERYDFYLISCAARQGTVSPCSYNVFFDTLELNPDKMQILTYKMCHLYFNWSGTVAVPAACQYAHKLAFLTAQAFTTKAHENLNNLLHFL